jgi:hypothetical protein
MSAPENHTPAPAEQTDSTPETANRPEAESAAADSNGSHPENAETSHADSPQKDTPGGPLLSHLRKMTRQRLLSAGTSEVGNADALQREVPIHLVALNGFLDKFFLSKLSKVAASKSDTETRDSEANETRALLEALQTEGPARPETNFPGKKMNVFGAAAAGGHLSQIPDSCFTREILVPPSNEGSVHFLEVAKAHGRLLEVPAFIWKRLQRLKEAGLSNAELATLKVLLALLEEVVAHYCGLLEANPSIYHTDIPADLRTEPALRALHRAHELKHYEQNAIPFEHLPQRFQTGEDALHAWSKPWIRLLAADTVSFDKIPVQLRDSEEARAAWAKPWLQKLASEPMASFQIPPELRNAPEAVAARKHFHCGAVSSGDEQALRGVPSELRAEPEVHEAMRKGWCNWLAAKGLASWNDLPELFRAEPTLIEQAADLWTARIQKEDVKWPDIHEEIRALDRVRTAWLEKQKLSAQLPASLAEIAAQPNVTRSTLDLWRHSNHWNRQRAVASLVELRNAPWLFGRLDAAARNHTMIADAAYGGITELVRRHWSYLQLCPEDFRSEPDLLELAATEWKAALFEGRLTWERIPQELHAAPSLAAWKAKQDAKQRSEARRSKQAAVEGRIQSAPHLQDHELTKKELKNAGVRKLRASYWAKKITEDRMSYMQVPESLMDLEALQNAMRKQWGPLIQQNPASFETFPDRIREDAGIQRVYKIATRSASEQ